MGEEDGMVVYKESAVRHSHQQLCRVSVAKNFGLKRRDLQC